MLTLHHSGEGDGHAVECPHLGPSVHSGQGYFVVGDGQPWP